MVAGFVKVFCGFTFKKIYFCLSPLVLEEVITLSMMTVLTSTQDWMQGLNFMLKPAKLYINLANTKKINSFMVVIQVSVTLYPKTLHF